MSSILLLKKLFIGLFLNCWVCEELKKLSEIIIDEDEEYKNIEKKIEVMEKELKILDGKYKCDINAKYKILNLSINQTKPYVYIYFELFI